MKQKTTKQLVQDLYVKVDSLSTTVQGLSGTTQNLSRKVKSLSGTVKSLSGTVKSLSGTVKSLSGTVQNLSKVVHDLSEYTIKGFGKVNERIDILEENMATKSDINKVYNLADQVIKEVKAMRQEQTVHRQEHDDIDKRLDNIESVPVIAHEIKKKK